MTFEEAMQELTQIVQQLENGNLSLDDSIKAYQKGMELSQICQTKLQDAKKSIVTMMDDTGQETPFAGEE